VGPRTGWLWTIWPPPDFSPYIIQPAVSTDYAIPARNSGTRAEAKYGTYTQILIIG